MPNWVTSRLTVYGSNAEKVIKDLTVSVDENGGKIKAPRIDFNKIIPMPKSLDILEGSLTKDCMELYLCAVNPMTKDYGIEKLEDNEFQKLLNTLNPYRSANDYKHILSVQEIEKREKSNVRDDVEFNSLEKLIAYGEKAIKNLKEYGHTSWYGWCNENWGTKWNACHCEIKETEVKFDTAWSDVRDLMCELSKLYPSNSFKYEWAEEQSGYYAGFAYIDDGFMEEVDLPDQSKEAYEMGFELFGGKDFYKFDKKSGTYHYIDEDENEDEEEM